jgi:plastocyanin
MDAMNSDQKMDAMNSDHKMDAMNSDHKMDAMKSDHKMDAMNSDHKMDAMNSNHKMDAMNSDHKMDAMPTNKEMPGKHVVIKMQGSPFRFEPNDLEIEVGTTVEWVNEVSTVHTVTDQNLEWDSGSLGKGEKFSKTFDQKGTFKYYCVPHRDVGMVGTIVVK